MNGTIIMPEKITEITVNEPDTLQIGEAFTISWSGSNAEYYRVHFCYEGENYFFQINEFVQGNSITFPTSTFLYDGIIKLIEVQPINGPFPNESSICNMIGDGSGYLYYLSQTVEYNTGGKIIVKGKRFNMQKKQSIYSTDKKPTKKNIRESIENIILGKEKK